MEPSNNKDSPQQHAIPPSQTYSNPFNLHFHNVHNIPSIPFEKRIVFEPNQIPFPEIVDPRHQSLTEDLEEFKHFRNVIAAFLNYKVRNKKNEKLPQNSKIYYFF